MIKKEKDLGSGWTVQEIISRGMRHHRRYFLNRRQAFRFEMKGHLQDQWAGLSLIEKDLRNVSIWYRSILKMAPKERIDIGSFSQDRETGMMMKGLYVACLASYGKCFSTAEGRKVKLDRSYVDEKFRELHDDTIHLRNNFAAHSGTDSYESVKIALVLPPKKEMHWGPLLFVELLQVDGAFQQDGELSLADLADNVAERVRVKMDKIREKILVEEVLPKGPDYWYRRVKKVSKP